MSRERSAAAVLIRRRGDGAIYLVERNPELRFFGGYWACPGGTVDAADAPGATPEARLRACALRELQEEVALEVEPAALRPLCRITTPPFAPVRYATQFFLVELPATVVPAAQPGELSQGRYWDPNELLASWRRGEVLIVPPVLLLLELCAGCASETFVAKAERFAAELDAGRLHPVRFTPGIFLAPLATHTRPPATTTNCLLVGERVLYVVDPGASEPGEQRRLVAEIERRQASGSRIAGILLTHGHPDHVGGVAMLSGRYRVPVYAHPLTLAALGPSALGPSALRPSALDAPTPGLSTPGLPTPGTPCRAVSQEDGVLEDGSLETIALEDGAELELGMAPDGSPGWKLRALHTPGHAPGHLAFLENRYHALVAGDLVSTVSTVVIDPPHGHLGTYLASLRRLLELELGTLYPGHGPPQRDGAAVVRHYLAHRAEREATLRAALFARQVATVESLVPIVYTDVDPSLHALAARSLLAGLIKLEEDGQAERHADGNWRAVTGG